MKTAVLVKNSRVVKAGSYTTITSINAPANVEPGSSMFLSVTIKNTWVAGVDVACIALANGQRFIDTTGADKWLQPDQQADFSGQSITMPNGQMVIDAWSYYKATDGLWYGDDYLQIIIRPPSNAQLTVLNSPVSGQSLQYSFSGFQPNAQVRVSVQGGGGVTNTADSNGAGTGSFVDGDPPGDYTLVAEDDYGHQATASFTVQAAAGWKKLHQISVPIAVQPTAGWSKLATQNIPIAVGELANWAKLNQTSVEVGLQETAGWAKLNQTSVAVGIQETAGWQKLATQNIPIAISQTAGWQKLATKEVTLKPGFEIPQGYKLVQSTLYPEGKTYKGKAERCTFQFKLTPEQIPGTTWIGKKLADSFAGEVEKQGGKMLELKVYENVVPTFWTEYLVIATAREAPLSPLLRAFPFPWTIVIALVLVAVILIALIFVIREIKTVDWSTPGGVLIGGLGILAAAGGAVLVIGAIAAASGKKKPAPARSKSLVAARR